MKIYQPLRVRGGRTCRRKRVLIARESCAPTWTSWRWRVPVPPAPGPDLSSRRGNSFSKRARGGLPGLGVNALPSGANSLAIRPTSEMRKRLTDEPCRTCCFRKAPGRDREMGISSGGIGSCWRATSPVVLILQAPSSAFAAARSVASAPKLSSRSGAPLRSYGPWSNGQEAGTEIAAKVGTGARCGAQAFIGGAEDSSSSSESVSSDRVRAHAEDAGGFTTRRQILRQQAAGRDSDGRSNVRRSRSEGPAESSKPSAIALRSLFTYLHKAGRMCGVRERATPGLTRTG